MIHKDLSIASYDFHLPEENIAQHPAEKRELSKLLVLNKQSDSINHTVFKNIPSLFKKGDILVINDTKVFPARLLGKKETGGKTEVFLLSLPTLSKNHDHPKGIISSEAEALIKSSRKPKPGSKIIFTDTLRCTVLSESSGLNYRVRLDYPEEYDVMSLLAQHGEVPLPPYIERATGTTPEDHHRYQTVYANHNGAVAAPTAGLHFTEKILEDLYLMGVESASLTLHVGYGTFAPVRSEIITDHTIHKEFISLSADSAKKINTAKNGGGKIWAVGTTTVRALEFSSLSNGEVCEKSGWCDLYIYPGYTFKVIDNLITNFHLPKSSLLFLVSALCGRKTLLNCYKEAINNKYRFYSYGDAMAILS